LDFYGAFNLQALSKSMYYELNSKSRVSDNLSGKTSYDDDMSSESDDCEHVE
jgi:hypothetical protein